MGDDGGGAATENDEPMRDGDPWWADGAPARPIPVLGGLVARSTRGGIGEQWWSRRFIAVMESLQLGGRLTRGRAYARKGQVISLDVEAGEARATVQGSRVTPYRVRIGLPKFTELVWAKAEVLLAEQAIHSARLLAGEFPAELESVFAGLGAPLFPARATDLAMSCSCPDFMVPCKHVAAAFYLLAERFDDDPFLILRWRGRDREALLARLRELRADDVPPSVVVPTDSTDFTDSTDPAGPSAPVPVLGARSALLVPEAPGTPDRGSVVVHLDAVGSFWTAGDVPPLPVHPDLPVDLVLRQLPVPGPGLGGSRLLADLAKLYEHLGRAGDESDTASRKPPET